MFDAFRVAATGLPSCSALQETERREKKLWHRRFRLDAGGQVWSTELLGKSLYLWLRTGRLGRGAAAGAGAGDGARRVKQPRLAGTFQPTLDAGDLWHVLRHGRADPLAGDPGARRAPTPGRNHFFVVAPTIASKPSTGLSVGLNSNLAFFTGDEKTTHISSVSGGLRVSQKKQVLSGVRFSMFTADDHWFISGRQPAVVDVAEHLRPRRRHAADRTGHREPEVQRDQALRDRLPHRAPAPVRRASGSTSAPMSNIRPGDGVLSTFDQSAYVAYNELHGFHDEAPDVGRHQRRPAVRHARQRHQRAARLARERGATARSSTGSSAAIPPGSS